MKLIKKRSGDWWFFILLPLFVFGIISFLLYIDGKSNIILPLTQYIYFYSLILSSTEIGLRSVMKAKLGSEVEFKGAWFGLLVLIISTILLMIIYFKEDIFNAYPYMFFIISFFPLLGAIWSSNQNEYSIIPNFREKRQENEENFSKKVETPVKEYREVKI